MLHQENKELSLDGLLNDIIQYQILPELTNIDIAHVRETCTAWHSRFFFNLDPKFLMHRYFNIPGSTLNHFETEIKKICPDVTINYHDICQRLQCAVSVKGDEATKLRYFYLNPEHHLILLACCLNLDNMALVIEEFVPNDERVAWLAFAIFARVNNTATPLLGEIELIQTAKQFAAMSGNLAMLRELMKRDRLLGDLVGLAARSGDLPTLQFLLDSDTGYKFTKSDFRLAILSKNKKMVSYLTEKFGKTSLLGVQPEIYAIESGDIEMWQWIAARYNLQSYESFSDLKAAAATGKLSLISPLMSQYSAQLDRDKFSSVFRALALQAAASGSVAALKLFLTPPVIAACRNPKPRFDDDKYQVGHETSLGDILEAAAAHGRMTTAQFLLDPANNFGVRITPETCNKAASSGNLELLQFLIRNEKRYKSLYEDASNSSNPDIMRLILDPDSNSGPSFGTVSDYFKFLPKIVCKNLVGAEYRVFQALRCIYHNKPENVSEHLYAAAQLSIRQCFRVTIHSILNPQKYTSLESLDAMLLEPLYKGLEALINIPCTRIEHDAVVEMLNKSDNARLQTLATQMRCAKVLSGVIAEMGAMKKWV